LSRAAAFVRGAGGVVVALPVSLLDGGDVVLDRERRLAALAFAARGGARSAIAGNGTLVASSASGEPQNR
jgi:hypothetical protein